MTAYMCVMLKKKNKQYQNVFSQHNQGLLRSQISITIKVTDVTQGYLF